MATFSAEISIQKQVLISEEETLIFLAECIRKTFISCPECIDTEHNSCSESIQTPLISCPVYIQMAIDHPICLFPISLLIESFYNFDNCLSYQLRPLVHIVLDTKLASPPI